MLSSVLVSSLFFFQIPQIQPISHSSFVSINQNSNIQRQSENSHILENLIKHKGIDGLSLSEKDLNQDQLVDMFRSVVESLDYNTISTEDLELLKELRAKFINELITLENCRGSNNSCSYYISNINFLLNKTINIYSKYQIEIENNIDKNSPNLNSRSVNINKSLVSNNKLRINGSISEIDYPLQTPKSLQPEYFSTDKSIFPRKLNIRKFAYNVPLNEKMNLTFSLVGNEIHSLNVLSKSRFSKKSPLSRLIQNGGVALNYQVNDLLSLVTGYYGGELKAKKSAFEGLLQGNSSFVSQIKFEPNKYISMGFIYIYSQNNSRLRLGGSQRSQLNLKNKIAAHSYGFDVRWQIHPQISVGGWIGFTDAKITNLGRAEIWNYSLTFGINDLNKNGDFLGITFGQPPKLTGTSGFKINGATKDSANFWLGEIFYYYPIAKNFSLTPSFMWISNPELKNSQESWKFNLKMKMKF